MLHIAPLLPPSFLPTSANDWHIAPTARVLLIIWAVGVVAVFKHRHDSPLLDETLDTLKLLATLPEQMNVHLDQGYDSDTTREKLKVRTLASTISKR